LPIEAKLAMTGTFVRSQSGKTYAIFDPFEDYTGKHFFLKQRRFIFNFS